MVPDVAEIHARIRALESSHQELAEQQQQLAETQARTESELKQAIDALCREISNDRDEKLTALAECTRSVEAVAGAIQDLRQELKQEHTANVQHHSITNENIISLWDKVGRTNAGKIGASMGMAGIGMFALKIVEALPAILSLLSKLAIQKLPVYTSWMTVSVFSVASKTIVYPGDACAARLRIGNNRIDDKRLDVADDQVSATLKKPDGKKVALDVVRVDKATFVARFTPALNGPYEVLFSVSGDAPFVEKGEIVISELVW